MADASPPAAPGGRHRPILVTGATGGLGRRIVLTLAARGRPVIVGGRRPEAIEAVAAEARAAGVEAGSFAADLSDLDDVRRAVDAVLDQYGEEGLGGIVTNAGLTLGRHEESAQGHELTFAVNVLAHQLLLGRTVPAVVEHGRIVVVASGVHDPDNRLARRAGVPSPRWVGADAAARPLEAADADRIDDTRQRYSNSKLANVLQARELQRRLRESGRSIDVFAIDPGLMVDTDLARSYPRPLQLILRAVGTAVTPLVGDMRLSATSGGHVADLLTDPALAGTGFAYRNGARTQPPSPAARRDDLARELWIDANRLVDLDASIPC
ncbi:MAG: SDR family NAD(P)-dependent oxidoreductase [Actinomycetota bacterium]